jgi:UDP-N-acetylmuramate: L-alanyl-gamma-D-glutamyl-meso-diaminopimelate ligase
MAADHEAALHRQQFFALSSVLRAVVGSHTMSRRIYFIGIGGMAMAGGAIMAKQLGFQVSGSDQKLYPPTSDLLQQCEIPYHEGYAAEHLGQMPDIIVLGNAISRGNPELEQALNARAAILSLPEFIAEYVIRRRQSYVIAGTHGKTTTTALVSHILRASGIDAGFMIGGVAGNFPRSAEVGSADAFVSEGDEYDTSIFDHRSKFLSYRPTHVLINNIEFDHADIFTDLADVERAFARLIKIIPENGLLVLNADNPSCQKLAAGARTRVVTFGEAADANFQLKDFHAGETSQITYAENGHEVQIRSSLKGRHNALNTIAALALLQDFRLTTEQIQRALDSFLGVKRRLELRAEQRGITVLEDFAHHPTAIKANIDTLRGIYGDRRLIILLEPRSNTMVRNFFQRTLADALARADVIFFDRIYRAEKYAEGERLDLAALQSDLSKNGKQVHMLPASDRVNFVIGKLQPGDVVCFMTNGSFSGLIGELAAALGPQT